MDFDSWKPRVTVGTLVEFEQQTGIDLLNAVFGQLADDDLRFGEGGVPLIRQERLVQIMNNVLSGKLANLVRLAYLAFQPQMAQMKEPPTFKDFYGSLDGAALSGVTAKVWEAYQDFFLSATKGRASPKVVEPVPGK